MGGSPRRDPDLLYYINNTTDSTGIYLTRLHVSSGSEDRLHDFSKDTVPGGRLAACKGTTSIGAGHDPFSISNNADLFGLGCYLGRNGPHGSAAFRAFSYRVSNNTIGKVFETEGIVPQALPTADGMYSYTEGDTMIKVLDPVTTATLRTVPWMGSEHSDMLINAAGESVVAGVQFDNAAGNGTLMVANLSKGGGLKTIIGEAKGDPYPPSGTLISGRAYRTPGWVAVGVVGEIAEKTTYLDQEILLANVDSGTLCRVAHHRTTGAYSNAKESNYWAQPNVVLSPSGTRILFQSDWGNSVPGQGKANPKAIVDTYVLELASYPGI